MCLCDHACVVDPAHWVPPCQEPYELQLKQCLTPLLKPSSFASSWDSLPDMERAFLLLAKTAEFQVELSLDP